MNISLSNCNAVVFNEKEIDNVICNNLLMWEKTTKTLPAGYTKVEYIETNGTQYIDLNYKYIFGDVVKIVVAPLEYDVDKALFGAYLSNSDRVEMGYMKNKFRANIGTQLLDYIIGQKYNIVCKENGLWYVDDVSAGNTSSSSTTSNCYLFARNYNGPTKLSHNRFWEMSIKRKNVLIHNFLPCKNPNDVIGLYDIVQGVFYPNSGTGEFTYAVI